VFPLFFNQHFYSNYLHNLSNLPHSVGKGTRMFKCTSNLLTKVAKGVEIPCILGLLSIDIRLENN
jgi:hypothetical protein